MPDRRITRIAIGTGLILLIPLLVMQFTDEVNWKIGDFIVMSILLISAGFAYQLLAQRMSTTAHRITLGIAIAVLVVLIWAELAVGIFGTPFAGS